MTKDQQTNIFVFNPKLTYRIIDIGFKIQNLSHTGLNDMELYKTINSLNVPLPSCMGRKCMTMRVYIYAVWANPVKE